MGEVLQLAVFLGENVATHALPEHGSATIGRSEECDIRIDHHSVSRKHALVHVGPPLEIEDLGSANGTFVPPERIAKSAPAGVETMDTRVPARKPIAFAPGESLNIGSVMVVVRRRVEAAGVVVCAPAMIELYALADRIAQGTISVLVQGETGSGKEILARHIHDKSPRASGPFLALNCASLADSLLESELFGHEKGAFTGAVQAKPGLLESAQGGTVFLDEIGEMPMATQVKLLRVIEERKVQRVGGLAPRSIDVRIVSATNRDLEAESTRGTFRSDLYFRLNGITLGIPPLRERRSEIGELADAFVVRAAAELGRTPPAISPEARAWMTEHPWSGNIRELRNVIERAVLLSGGEALSVAHLAPRAGARAAAPVVAPVAPVAPPPNDDGVAPNLKGEMAALERSRILDALTKCGGNQTQAAQLLGMSRRTFVQRLSEYGVPRPRKSGA